MMAQLLAHRVATSSRATGKISDGLHPSLERAVASSGTPVRRVRSCILCDPACELASSTP